jgi:hypothetical protein
MKSEPIALTGRGRRTPEGWLLPTGNEAEMLGGICFRLGDPQDRYPETMQTPYLRGRWLKGWKKAKLNLQMESCGPI